MEETMQTLLQSQDTLDGPSVEGTLDLMKAYKDKLLEEMWKQQDSLEGPAAPIEEPVSPRPTPRAEDNVDDTRPLLERLRALEAENSALSMENDNQRKQYERCLDEVANQVVQALLTQKDLKEECVKLRTRVFDLEQQNRILSVLFQQRAKTTNTVALAQEVQRNGKANFHTGRWPSLLSLTCPRSSCSGSGSDASLSSACSEYSSGSHTWAEGHGSSKQSATSREKRMSAGSVSGNPTVACDNGELAWKEGHILKGLKRLQMRSPKKPPSLPSVSHCKDCMTSNEGIYSHGVMGGPQVTVPKQAVTVGHEPFKAGAGVVALISDSDDGDEDSPKFQTRNTYDQPLEESLGLEDPSTTPSGKVEKDFPKKLTGNHGHFLLPLPDEFLLEGLTLKPGVSPTESPNHVNTQKNSLDKFSQTCLKKVNDRNNNQEKATDRKSRLDYDKRKQDRFLHKQLGKGLIEGGTPIQHSAKKALSCVSEARQRSSSMDTHCRDHSTQAGGDTRDCTILESPQRKIKPQACDSAKRAFILRSKSADGGSEQTKQLHSPLQQKLIKIHRSKGQSKPVHSTSNLSKNDSSIQVPYHKVEKVENPAVGQVSPLSSPVKHSHVFKPNEAPNSPTETPLQNNILSPNSDSFTESPVSNKVPTSPMKQLYLEQHAKVFHSEPHSSSPPPPPDRSISLLIRPVCESSPKANKSTCQSPTSSPGKAITSTSKHKPSMATKCTDNIITRISSDLQSPKCVPTEVNLESSTSLPGQEYHASDSPQSSLAVANHEGNCTSIQVSSDPIHFDVPQASTDFHFHGIGNLYQNSNPRATKTAVSVNAKSLDAIPNPGQGNNTFLILENKGNANASTKCLQTFAHAHQMIHEGNETGAKDKVRRKSETRCSSLDSEPSVQPAVEASGVMLDWGFDEEGWLFKRSVSVSTRPPLKPVMGMNGAKARSQSFGARYMDKPSFNRSGKVRTQITTHSGSSLNSLSDVFSGSMSCSSSYHCPMNRSLLSNFLIEEGLPIPSHLASSSERLQSLKQHREQARRLQIEQQFSSAFGEPVSEESEQQNTITTIEEKVMLGIEENLHKSQEQERTNEAKQKSSSSFASWFGFRKSKLPAPSSKKVDSPKVKEEKREQKITSLLGGKQSKCDKKKDRRKIDGKDSSAGRREAHDAVRACISMPCPGMSLNEMQGHTDVCCGDPKMQMINRSADGVNGCSAKSPSQEPVSGSGCKMRTLDSGIGTIPLPESCSFFSSILHLLPKSTSTPDPSLSPPSGSSSEDVSPSPLPRWKIPLGSKDHGHSGIPTSLSDCPMTQSVPFPAVAFLQSVQPQSAPGVTSVCDTQSKLPRLAPGGMEPKKLTYVQSKPRAIPSQQKEKRMK